VGKVWNIENARRTIVGVVLDSGANQIVDGQSVEAYVPIEDARADTIGLIVHSRDLPNLLREVPRVAALSREQLGAISMRSTRDRALDAQEKIITVLGSLGVAAAALAAAGMFAMVAFTVAQRTREIGIRMAIGARGKDVIRVVLAGNLGAVLTGMSVGTAMGGAMGQIARSRVELVQNPLDPLGFALGLGAFLLTALLATLAPAIQALRIDPSSTLRME
jgi:putative ABC transport system permease protein